MKNLNGLVVSLLLISLVLVSSCTVSNAPGSSKCQEGLCVRIQATGPVTLNKSVQIIVVAQSNKDIPGLVLGVGVADRSIILEEPHEEKTDQFGIHKSFKQKKDAKANVPAQLATTIRFTQEGYFNIFATAEDRQFGVGVSDVARVWITAQGGDIYLAGTPIPITPGTAARLPTITPGPSPTPQTPTPTRVRPLTPTRPPYP